MTDGLRAFLARLVLDEDFRTLVGSNPDAAFEGYALTDEQRDILRARDRRMLGLLGQAAGAPVSAAPVIDNLPTLEDSWLRIQLVPQAWQEEGQLRISYSASVHPWPSETEAGAVSFLVRIAPRASRVANGQLRLSYAATIQPAPTGEAPALPEVGEATPWGHRTDSAATAEAARAVHAALPEERYDRLIDLIGELTK